VASVSGAYRRESREAGIIEDQVRQPSYDAFDADRSDLDVYLAIAQELDAGSVLDVGCGTGTFAVLLAREGSR
jgi:2-polyprenyl-3-methyl-5-hydroxy-6-metoxy-1,4-benzoquinol methylase